MGRMYTACNTAAFGTAAGDHIEITAGATESVVLHELVITGQTETDDSNVVIIELTDAAGSGATATNANPTDSKTSADSATVDFNNTVDSTGSKTELWREGMSILAGFHKIWTPETRIVVNPTEILLVRFSEVWTADPTLSTTVVFEEIG